MVDYWTCLGLKHTLAFYFPSPLHIRLPVLLNGAKQFDLLNYILYIYIDEFRLLPEPNKDGSRQDGLSHPAPKRMHMAS